jgi:acyl-CoA synthetase (AMP-forming)/AMP-acid ligase II
MGPSPKFHAGRDIFGSGVRPECGDPRVVLERGSGRRLGGQEGVNVGLFLTRAARSHPDRIAIRYGDATRTYAELSERARRLAAGLLDLGLAPGDRVVILQTNRPELIESLFAGLLGGLVVVPVNARLHPEEVAHIVRDSGAAALVHSREFDEPLRDAGIDRAVRRISTGSSGGGVLAFESVLASAAPLASPMDVAPERLAWLFYTSGTTGRPKGVMLTHRNIRVATMNFLADVCAIGSDDVVLHAAPLTHGSGSVSLAAVARGATNVILDSPSFDPREIGRLVERWGVTTIAFLAPTQIVRLQRDPEFGQHDLSTLRTVCYGGGPMYVEDLKEAIRRFGPIWVQIFGQGEAPMTISSLSRGDHARWAAEDERRLGSAGLPRTDVEVRVVDEDGREIPAGEIGEIVVRGDVVMAGYWNAPEATSEVLRDGWLHTGDLGTFDDLGYLYVLDRAKDMIVTGGHNVYAREVEDVLLRHPRVAEVAVIGVPDDYWGESVMALVVPDGKEAPTANDLVAFCREHLASYKKPRSVEFVSGLPKNSQGKLLKRELRARYWVGYERRVGGGVRPDRSARR